MTAKPARCHVHSMGEVRHRRNLRVSCAEPSC
jgi:hypothetical protein